MQPRTEDTALAPIGVKMVLGCVVSFLCAIASECLAESGFELIDWEAEWAESTGSMAIGMLVAAVVAVLVILVMKKNSEKVQLQN